MATTKNGKKYKLFAAAADGSKPPCAFFGTAEGCNKGDSCPFLHSTVVPGTPPDAINTNNSVVSTEESESESETEQQPVAKAPPKAVKQESPVKEETTTKKKKNKRSRDSDQVFAKPKGTEGVSFKYSDLLDLADDGKGRLASPPKEGNPPQPKQKKAKKTKENSAKGPDFRSLDLPIADFMLPTDGKQKTPKEKAPATPKKAAETPAPAPTPKRKSKYSLPSSTQVGRKWKDVVAKTLANPEFSSIFDYKKYKAQDIPGDVWVKSKPFGEWCADHPQAIAIDCEMCETTDPVSGNKNHSALCRISIVNAEDPEDVLLNTLVKPAWPVSDYRTWVNGITKEHLEPVQFTLRHAQAFMMTLCSEETVILGHAVHNDLASMRMEHYCVGDSALLFKAKDSPTATVSLKDLAMGILKKEMPATHDSVNDAVTSLLCLDHFREKDGQVEEVVRTPKARDTGNRTHHKLFIHRIPKFCTQKHLARMFLEHTSIAPEDVDDIEFSGNKGKTHVIFRTPRHAGLVFDTLAGEGEKEGSGRLQKKVWLRDGDYVQVRKMTFEKGHTFPDGSEIK